MPAPFEGGCRCRAIRYRCATEPAAVLHCYCRDCQYSSGTAGTTAVVVMAESMTVEGSPTTFTVESDSGTPVERLFCATCGTPLFGRNPNLPFFVSIKAATLDDPSWLEPGAHIWTDSAPPWACMVEGLPRFAKNFGAT